jgi:hypothetical protein
MAESVVKINRAPVLTLWAAVVAQALGFNWEESLTMGKILAGLNAQSKGRRLGIFEPGEEKSEKARQRTHDEEYYIMLLGRSVPVVNRADGIRALDQGRVTDPESVQRYLDKKFGEALPQVRKAMEELAQSYEPSVLAREAFDLYEKFRPKIPEGKKGWGAQGDLDLGQIRSLRSRTE